MEFRRAMERLGLVTRVEDVKQMRRLWRMLDEEDAGIVDYRTFCIKLFPECAPRKGGRTGGRVGEGCNPSGDVVSSPSVITCCLCAWVGVVQTW